jgi:two-component system, NarL family, sensor kinase
MNVTAEVIVALVATTVVLFLLATFIIAFVFFFRQKQTQYKADKVTMEKAFEQELLQAQIEVQEQTLKHISQELHDNIGQILSLVKINLNHVDFRKEEAALQKIDNTKILVSKALSDLRSLAKTLDSNYVLRSKLSEALQFELGYIEQASGCATALRVEGEERLLSAQQQIVIFRVAQEVLNNAMKHANANNLTIELTFEPAHFYMRITDDGVGFDLNAKQPTEAYERGAGLTNMYTRSALIGARFALQSTPGLGTTALLEI